MFQKKQTKLFEVPQKRQRVSSNTFISSNMQRGAITTSGNGAMKYDSHSDAFVEDFSNLTKYRVPRKFNEISETMSRLFAINSYLAVCMIIYIRMITRVTNIFTLYKTEKAQKGQGLRHEGILRMVWLHIHHPKLFWNNIHLFISAGSWKDIFDMLRYDLEYNGWDNRVLNWNRISDYIIIGLGTPSQSDTIKKYIPQIYSRSNADTLRKQSNTMIGKFLCFRLNISYEQLRKIKSKGKQHTWQQLISNQEYDKIDIDQIHGRALFLLSKGKFFRNHGSDLYKKYSEWAAKPGAKVKFTGYVHELGHEVVHGKSDKAYYDVINAQFRELLSKAGKANSGLLPVLDVSGSMRSNLPGQKFRSQDVARSIALFFSHMLEGDYHMHYAEFASTTRLKVWQSSNFVDNMRFKHVDSAGSTNFQGILKLWQTALENNVPVRHLPKGIICISDGEFNNTNSTKTNYTVLMEGLKRLGLPRDYIEEFKIIMWDIPNTFYSHKVSKTKFETYFDCPNMYYMSGLDPSIITFLLEGKKIESTNLSTAELIKTALSQEIMQLVNV